MDYRTHLIDSFNAAVAAADPLKIVAAHLPQPPKWRTLVVGAGKAAASMARAVELAWPADAALVRRSTKALDGIENTTSANCTHPGRRSDGMVGVRFSHPPHRPIQRSRK